ncbi:ABR200Wp [Eremothecium gossypii ATCC 10895]|uniref:ABR200Wp n=1 Tax=Eremothecium gossypii (strain ATCC 10895 / CBS 109.51 / FGSC 9923 / NRRL Y-1056) TaxID=284811 RepID=Q75D22_EREGS|nr:ABR200Wp [Eremothecium gossypii ATCC 10895]AAS50973.1 ABR200Wp [Eremothecium gossypii ATCC 10895]
MAMGREQLYDGHINMYPHTEQQSKRKSVVFNGKGEVVNDGGYAPYPVEEMPVRMGTGFLPPQRPALESRTGSMDSGVLKPSIYLQPGQHKSSPGLPTENRPTTWYASPTKSSLDGGSPSSTASRERAHKARNRPLPEFSKDALYFYKIFEKTISDSGTFTPSVQMKWCETLLEYAFKPDFIAHYSINAEKLKRELTPEEQQKNKTTLLEHALKVLSKLMRMKYAPALYLMGTLYSQQPYLRVDHDGIVSKNDQKALEYYKSAAKLKNADGCYRAGVSYEYNRGMPANISRRDRLLTAVSFYEKGAACADASSGQSSSMYKLGMFQLNGLVDDDTGEIIVEQDVISAIRWFERAAAHDKTVSPQALYELAKIYEFDCLHPQLQQAVKLQHVPQDTLKALDLYIRCAIKFNYPLAQWKLGHCYEYAELHLPYSPEKSIVWYLKAANAAPKGNAMAMLALSGWYLTGVKGVLEPNASESYKWAYKASIASEGRLPKAEYALGFYTEHAVGCHPDMHRAMDHYRRAAELGHQKAVERLSNI